MTHFLLRAASMVLLAFALTASPARAQQAAPKLVSYMPSDFNGDGHADILWHNNTTGAVHRMLMRGPAIQDAATVYAEPDPAWTIVGTGDFNADGKTDLLWRNEATGDVYMMLFDYNARPAGGYVIYREPDPDWKIVATVDLNGDFFSDILWWNARTGRVWAQLMHGILLIEHEGEVFAEPNTDWKIAAVGRFDAPGDARQLVWHNRTTGEVYLQRILHVGGGEFTHWGEVIYTEPDTSWRILSAPDLDGDRRSDLLWRNELTGQVHGMLMLGSQIVAQAGIHRPPDLAWQVVAAYDYDLDSRADLLWRHEGDGRVWMMRMDGLAIAGGYTVYVEPDADWRIMGPLEYGRQWSAP